MYKMVLKTKVRDLSKLINSYAGSLWLAMKSIAIRNMKSHILSKAIAA
jgi:hypothetical protein